jgi:hypothetical protein
MPPTTKHESQALHERRPTQFDTGYSLAVRCLRARCSPPLAPSPGRYGECTHGMSSDPLTDWRNGSAMQALINRVRLAPQNFLRAPYNQPYRTEPARCPKPTRMSRYFVRSAVSRSTKCGASLKAAAATRRFHNAFSSVTNALRLARRSLLTRLPAPRAHKIWPYRSSRISHQKLALEPFEDWFGVRRGNCMIRKTCTVT